MKSQLHIEVANWFAATLNELHFLEKLNREKISQNPQPKTPEDILTELFHKEKASMKYSASQCAKWVQNYRCQPLGLIYGKVSFFTGLIFVNSAGSGSHFAVCFSQAHPPSLTGHSLGIHDPWKSFRHHSIQQTIYTKPTCVFTEAPSLPMKSVTV